uniref:Uncharacterized protein n=1 Tax=Anguilla anguilla TaxID=7936 RepID=A0A0E9SC63_ANGAN
MELMRSVCHNSPISFNPHSSYCALLRKHNIFFYIPCTHFFLFCRSYLKTITRL